MHKENRRPPAPGLKGAGAIFPTSSLPHARLPSLQTHSFSGTCDGKLVSPEVLALHTWEYSQDSCDVWSAS